MSTEQRFGPLPTPQIRPTPEALPFWEACRDHRLVLPHCTDCDRPFFYPRTSCPVCGSRRLGWVPATGRGTLHSFCVQHQSSVPGFAHAVPFVTALVDLHEGPRLMSLLVGAGTDPTAIRVGGPLRAVFLDTDDGWSLPAFEPVPAAQPEEPGPPDDAGGTNDD